MIRNPIYSVAMYLSQAILVTFAAFALGDPIPQAAATTTAITDLGSSPSEAASVSDALASLSALESLEAGMPTLASSIESVLLTAIPTNYYTGQVCETTTPGWYISLPADVKSAISSYDSAFASWYSLHSTAFSLTATLPGNVCAGTIFNTATTGHATATSGATATSTGKGTTTATGTGTAASGTSSSSSTSTSKAAAPHATGAVGVSVAGVLGALGLMFAL